MELKFNRNLRQQREFFEVLSKRMRTNSTIQIGWEWEIPFSPRSLDDMGGVNSSYDFFVAIREESGFAASRLEDEEYDNRTDHPFFKQWLRNLGYISHIECGGLEVGSPIYPSIDMARAGARAMVKTAGQMDVFEMEGNVNPWNDCGIHVHASDRRPCVDKVSALASLMMNRSENEEFLGNLSGRFAEDQHTEYMLNAQPDGWDSHPDNEVYHSSEMVRSNGIGTMELRLFGSQSYLLLPAIDMAHSLFKFCRAHLDKVGPRNVDLYENHVRYWNKRVPRLTEWADWINKQKGYRELKATADFNLLT